MGKCRSSNWCDNFRREHRLDFGGSGITRIYQADNTDLNIGNATGRGTLLGTWYYDGDTIKSSNKKIKNSIEEIDDRYSLLFDNLKPVRYKYNAGTSDRYHTGLIAQDVKTR